MPVFCFLQPVFTKLHKLIPGNILTKIHIQEKIIVTSEHNSYLFTAARRNKETMFSGRTPSLSGSPPLENSDSPIHRRRIIHFTTCYLLRVFLFLEQFHFHIPYIKNRQHFPLVILIQNITDIYPETSLERLYKHVQLYPGKSVSLLEIFREIHQFRPPHESP